MRDSPVKLFTFWSLQGVWVFVTLLPTLMANSPSARDPALTTQDLVGWSLWGIGMAFEVIADLQKSLFRMNPENKDKFIQEGLWSISRHPNYFGEILLWAGLYVSASTTFRGAQYLAVLSPLFVYVLITRVSGVPILESQARKRWGHLAEYQRYLRQTPILVPFLK